MNTQTELPGQGRPAQQKKGQMRGCQKSRPLICSFNRFLMPSSWQNFDNLASLQQTLKKSFHRDFFLYFLLCFFFQDPDLSLSLSNPTLTINISLSPPLSFPTTFNSGLSLSLSLLGGGMDKICVCSGAKTDPKKKPNRMRKEEQNKSKKMHFSTTVQVVCTSDCQVDVVSKTTNRVDKRILHRELPETRRIFLPLHCLNMANKNNNRRRFPWPWCCRLVRKWGN